VAHQNNNTKLMIFVVLFTCLLDSVLILCGEIRKSDHSYEFMGFTSLILVSLCKLKSKYVR